MSDLSAISRLAAEGAGAQGAQRYRVLRKVRAEVGISPTSMYRARRPRPYSGINVGAYGIRPWDLETMEWENRPLYRVDILPGDLSRHQKHVQIDLRFLGVP